MRHLAKVRAKARASGLVLAGSVAISALISIAGCTSPAVGPARLAAGSGPVSGAMVVTANPLATAAGRRILESGGSAADAAVTVAAVLGLVEPQSSGFGGGGFMLHFNAQAGHIDVYDGRETAPGAATPAMFLGDDGKRLKFFTAKNSGRSIGVPGMVSMLSVAQREHGKRAWSTLFAEPVEIAKNGFAVSARMHASIKRYTKRIPVKSDARDYLFLASGEPLPTGHVLRNLDYAKTLQAVAASPMNFYTGDIAQQIVASASAQPLAGTLSMSDLAGYRARKQSPLCQPYRGRSVCGPPPASSWLAVGMILGLLEAGPEFTSGGAFDADNWAVFAQAQRLAYVDRDRYVADDEFVAVPVSGLLHPQYLSKRAGELTLEAAKRKVAPGDPWAFNDSPKSAYAHDETDDLPGTTHFVIVDHDGNVVSLTASVEGPFGSTRMAGGMLLNNQLTDFSFKPTGENGQPVANAVAPGKRPRSSMSPTIVLDANGKFEMATGSPGGSSIIAYTAKTLVGVFDWGLTPQQAVDLPNVVARRGKVRIEESRAPSSMIDRLIELGFNVKKSKGENSGLSVVLRDANGKLVGGVDSRREGTIASF